MKMLSKFAFAASAAACVGAVVVMNDNAMTAAQPVEFDLCHVQVIFRHGARTPLYVPEYLPIVAYEKELLNHAPETFVKYKVVPLSGIKHSDSPFEKAYKKRGTLSGGCLPGQLTHIGADQTFQLGRYLRKRYINQFSFLGPSYEELYKEIYTRSTNIERTIDSARCVLAGLTDGQSGANPLHIHVASANEEIMYPNYYTCAHLKHLTRWAWDTPDEIPGFREMREVIQKTIGLPMTQTLDMVAIRDNFAVEAQHQKPSLQSSLGLDVKQKIENAAMMVMKTAFVGPEKVRDISLKLAIGPFVDVLVSNMEKACYGDDSQSSKLNLYSGHDTTLIPLLSALGVEFTHWPSYASNVILELHRKTSKQPHKNEYYVRLLYNNEEQPIGSCPPGLCPFEEFKKSINHVRMSYKEYVKDCILDGRV